MRVLFFFFLIFYTLNIVAGRITTNEELEEMLETGNPSIFTSDVSLLLEKCLFPVLL